MTLLCERCYGPIDARRERFYQLAHIAQVDRAGHVAWNHASVHVDACGASTQAGDTGDVGAERRAA